MIMKKKMKLSTKEIPRLQMEWQIVERNPYCIFIPRTQGSINKEHRKIENLVL